MPFPNYTVFVDFAALAPLPGFYLPPVTIARIFLPNETLL